MSRILIIGCPGSGKSTLARALAQITGLPLYYLDMIWHRPDGTEIDRVDFDKELERILRQDHWIIDGNYLRTLSRRLERADTVIWLHLPTDVCLEGAISRIGHPREDLPWVEEELDPEFKAYIQAFEQDQVPEISRLLAACPDKVMTFTSREAINEWIRKKQLTS